MLTGAADRREEEEGRRRRYLFDLKTTGIHYCFLFTVLCTEVELACFNCFSKSFALKYITKPVVAISNFS